MSKILITGGSGFLGSHLIPHLKSSGCHVSLLSRKIQSGVSTFLWDVNKQTMDASAFNDTHTIVHLAGAGIADKRWTNKYKTEIIESRIRSAGLLMETLKKNPGHKF